MKARVIVFIAPQTQLRRKKIARRAINSIAWDFQRIRHTQFIYKKLVDFKTLNFRSADDETANGDGPNRNGPNRQRAKRESSDTLRSDCQCADAHSRQII
jgi:hypothetical protein